MMLAFFSFFIYITISQINITSYTNFPNYTNSLYSVQLNNDGTEVYISVFQTVFKVIHLNITDPANIYRLGQYKHTNPQTYGYYKTFIIKDYFIASAPAYTTAKIFNLTSYQLISQFAWATFLLSGFPIPHKNIYVFGDDSGKFFYLNLNFFPATVPMYVFNSTTASYTMMSKTFDDKLICVSYETLSQVRVFDVENWAILTVIYVPSGGVQTTVWSLDNRFLLVFPYSYTFFLVYDRNSSWSLYTNVSTGYYYVKKCFVYNETNVALCNGQYNKVLFSINLFDFSVNQILTGFVGERYHVSQNNKIFSYYRSSLNYAQFYKINPFCTGIYFYNIRTKICQPCDPNCLTCFNSTLCSVCVVNYTFFNGTCRPCGSNELYNSSTKLCDDVSSFCSGDQYFSIPLLTCVQCQAHCVKCSSTTTCQQCAINFTLTNGSCLPCGPNELYNSSTRLCDDVSNFCTGDQYFSIPALACVQCLKNCGKCLSTTTCQYCVSNYSFVNGTCVVCGSNELYNSSTKLCDDVSSFCSGDQYFSIPLLTCVQCQANCTKCASISQCSVCQSNFTLMNGACQLCEIGKFYNLTTLLCENCLANCDSCTSTSTCNQCSLNYIFTDLPSPSCQLNSSPGTFSNSSNQTYGTFCTSDCQSCESQSQCSVCAEGFSLTQNKKCIFCGKNEVYDSQKDQCVVSPHTFYKQIMELTLQSKFLQETNKIPGNRIFLQQVFSFFINMDHLWLYLYHERKYGLFMSDFFESIRKLEQTKWSSISEEFLSEKFNLNWAYLGQKINWKQNQTSWKYLQEENLSTSFLNNTLKFFVLNFPLLLLICISLKVIYHFMLKTRLRKFMKEYSFKLFFITILMEGNSESFSYFFVFDCINLTSENNFQKWINLVTLLLFMVFTFYLFAWYFIIRYIQKRKSKYFFKEYQTNLSGLVHITLQSNVFNFFLGACHIVMVKTYENQLQTLICIEISYVFLELASIRRRRNIYKLKYTTWLKILASLIRIYLVGTFFLDESFDEDDHTFDQVQMLTLIIYMSNWLISTLIACFLLLMEIRKYLASILCLKKRKKEKNLKFKIKTKVLNQQEKLYGLKKYFNSSQTPVSFGSTKNLQMALCSISQLEIEKQKESNFKVSWNNYLPKNRGEKESNVTNLKQVNNGQSHNFQQNEKKIIKPNNFFKFQMNCSQHGVTQLSKFRKNQIKEIKTQQKILSYHKIILKKFNKDRSIQDSIKRSSNII